MQNLNVMMAYLEEVLAEVAKLAVTKIGKQVNGVAKKMTASLTTEKI